MEIINWGVLGCGGIARQFAASLAVLENGKLVAGASRTTGKAEAFTNEFGAARSYNNYEALVSDPEIDAVYIATTHNFHFENVKLCLEHGKHVLCEKPMTVNEAQSKALAALAQEKNLFLMEGLWTRFLPAIQKIKQLVDEGSIGEIQTVHADFCIGVEVDETHRLKNKALAGGALLDLGIYPINMAAIVFGRHPEKMTSSVVLGKTGVDYSSFYHFEYPEGKHAVLSSSFIECSPCTALIQGTKGYISTPSYFHSTSEFKLHVPEREPEVFKFPCPPMERFKYEIAHAMECIQNGKTESDIMPLSETIAIMETMDTLRAQWGLQYEGE